MLSTINNTEIRFGVDVPTAKPYVKMPPSALKDTLIGQEASVSLSKSECFDFWVSPGGDLARAFFHSKTIPLSAALQSATAGSVQLGEYDLSCITSTHVDITTTFAAGPGVYTLSYFAATREWVLSTDDKSWRCAVEEGAWQSHDMNGIGIYFGSDCQEVWNKDSSQVVFTISRPDADYNYDGSDFSQGILPIGPVALGLHGMQLISRAQAVAALANIDRAISAVSDAIARYEALLDSF